MPPYFLSGQPDKASDAIAWFRSEAGRAILDSEQAMVERALAERQALPWLWLAPVALPFAHEGRGVALRVAKRGWTGALSCDLPLPLPTEAFGTVVLQHAVGGGERAAGLLAEAARVLVPGGRLWLFVLNPLAPYRWRWRGLGLRAAEPLTWRRRLRTAGLQPDPVSQGLGPSWKIGVSEQPQNGPGLRAAYLIRAEKRTLPLTPLRKREPLRLSQEAPAG
jgi:SAM-dependent methyltransferase